MRKYLSGFLLIVFLSYLLNGAVTYIYAREALCIWFEKLVPSMFVSMVFVRLLYQMGVLKRISYHCRWFIQPLFHLDSHAFSLVIASLFLGFPTASVFIDEEVQKGYIKGKDASRLIACCCFATPGFIILSCGNVLYQSTTIGLQFFFISAISGMVLLLLTRKQHICIYQIDHDTPPFFQTLSKAMFDSGKALFMIGGYLMIVMSVSALFVPYLPKAMQLWFQAILEFSNGTMLIATQPLCLETRLIATAALLAFGGLCVHLQIFAMCPHSQLHYPRYLCFRIIQVCIAIILAILVF